MAGALPTETCNAEPVMISVCNLTTNKIESIDESTYNDTDYSKDTTKCKTELSVCDTTTGQVVTVTEDEYNADTERYSKTTTNCSVKSSNSTVTVCDLQVTPAVQTSIPASEYAADTNGRYTTDLTQCSGQTTQ